MLVLYIISFLLEKKERKETVSFRDLFYIEGVNFEFLFVFSFTL